MNDDEVKNRFNDLRRKYGEILINLKRAKVPSLEWEKYIFKNLSDEELAFIYGSNIWKFADREGTLDLGKGTRAEIEQNSSRLAISPEKAGILTWICTDGYMDTHSGGHYISIKDDNIKVFDYFTKIIEKTYGKVNFQISKVKDKNAFQCLFCSKEIFRDVVTYIPLSSSKNWTIPIEILDKEAKREVLRVLTHTEGSTYQSRRTRVVRVTLSNFEVLIQAKYLFKEFEIETLGIKNMFYGGWTRYYFEIGDRENLEKFREKIHFIPDTEKYDKFENIIKGYKEYHRPSGSCPGILLDTIKKNKFSRTKDLIRLSGIERATISRNLKKLRDIGAIDYKKGEGIAKHWFAVYG